MVRQSACKGDGCQPTAKVGVSKGREVTKVALVSVRAVAILALAMRSCQAIMRPAPDMSSMVTTGGCRHQDPDLELPAA